MTGYEGLDIWQLGSRLRNPMGPAAAFSPGMEIPAVSSGEVEDRRRRAREEFSARGFTDTQIDAIEAGGLEGNDVIAEHLAAGGSRYGETPED